MKPTNNAPAGITLLLAADDSNRAAGLRQILSMVVPSASIVALDTATIAEGAIPAAHVALLDAGSKTRLTVDTVRVLRARGFEGPIVILIPEPDDDMLRGTAQSLGARCISRSAVEATPAELGEALIAELQDGSAVAEVSYARRVFAAGLATLSLQHSINNPLAALLAETQLLQLEELTTEQRESVERIVELCRRVVALVRRLDALAVQ